MLFLRLICLLPVPGRIAYVRLFWEEIHAAVPDLIAQLISGIMVLIQFQL